MADGRALSPSWWAQSVPSSLPLVHMAREPSDLTTEMVVEWDVDGDIMGYRTISNMVRLCLTMIHLWMIQLDYLVVTHVFFSTAT